MLSNERVFEYVDTIANINADYLEDLICADEWRERVATAIREALAEQAETHAIELRAYEANMEQRIRELQETVAEYDRRIVAVGGVAINSVSREHHEAEVSRLNDLYEKAVAGRQAFRKRVRELEALMVPGGFPSDVITAAGLVYHGKRDKVLAERLSIGAQSMLAAAPALKEDTSHD